MIYRSNLPSAAQFKSARRIERVRRWVVAALALVAATLVYLA
jgi:hypothetical protein